MTSELKKELFEISNKNELKFKKEILGDIYG